MSIKKSSIQEALIEAREIEKSAIEKAKKILEEELAPKIKEVANQALKDYEQESLKEGLNVELPQNAELTIKISSENTPSNGDVEIPEITNDIEGEISDETEETPEEITNNNNEEDMEEIFEIEGLNEPNDAVQPAQPNAEVAPVETPDAVQGAEAPATEEATIQTVNSKLDDILSKIDAISAEGGNQEGEGEVSIIEDEPEGEIAPDANTQVPGGTAIPDETPVPAPAPALQEDEFELDDDTDEEVVYEMEDEGHMEETDVVYELEDDMNELNSDSIMELFNELEIVDEDAEEDDANMDEVLGVSFSTENKAGRRGHIKAQKGHHNPQAPMSQNALKEGIDKIKAQYGSKFDELSKENESLKKEKQGLSATLKEYKESFIVLRKQINEVQIFNAKLAYANKLFTNGGLTNDEKIKIAEEFDKVESIEDAKKLYNNFLNEMKDSKSTKTTSIDKLKSASPAVMISSNTQTLYESDEIRRMKRLAGISKKVEE